MGPRCQGCVVKSICEEACRYLTKYDLVSHDRLHVVYNEIYNSEDNNIKYSCSSRTNGLFSLTEQPPTHLF
jgi:hypothetical protein